jgi:acetyltransferase-like isoleucine patch superfamily enzyme
MILIKRYLISGYNFLLIKFMVILNGFYRGIGVQLLGNISINKSSFVGDWGTLSTGPDGLIVVEKGVSIGKNSWIASGNGKIVISKECLFGPRLTIVAQNHSISPVTSDNFLPWDRDSEPNDVYIGMRCSVGANVTILPGVSIGDYAVIAANSVVNRDVESFSIYGGVPAKLLKRMPIFENVNDIKYSNRVPHRHLSNRFF